ncbi:MAG: lipoyl synthase [Chitinivibrionales bacterium]|nr:lipoyl synthase [Chitinivibrionales bacterium]MBD3357500.1 lipoyl synthase [Chitinivibrionales bacterium]
MSSKKETKIAELCGGNSADARPRHPEWLRRPVPKVGQGRRVQEVLRKGGLHTVCDEAACPNRGECFCRGTATFLILGDHCTRNCRFCNVAHGTAPKPDPDEPARLAEAVRTMGLSHVVVTSVTRDDLADGGAGQFARTIRLLKQQLPGVTVEVLVPDFGGALNLVDIVMEARPDVFNHNIETVPRVYPLVRPQADFDRSLKVLERAAELVRENVVTKSGMMVGLGETDEEVVEAMRKLRGVQCRVLTIGQYLQPARSAFPVRRYVTPDQFSAFEREGKALGFDTVVAGPFVRSSYRAAEVFDDSLEHGSDREHA